MGTFSSYLRTIIDLGRSEASKDGSATVEAQHLLLALAVGPVAAPRQLLAEAGLDHAAIRAALSREFQHSLAAAGVTVDASDLPAPSYPDEPAPHLGTSARLALERGMDATARKNPRPAHLLAGILLAQVGTVPRALELVGIDRAALAERARRAASS
jgi:ATP-dependent Clp protease ATP-binding subunit ClpA